MTSSQSQLVSCRGRLANVELRGSGPDVVFVGAAVPMSWTRPAASRLADAGHRVINFDYGASHPDPEPRTALDQVDDVLDVMDAIGVESAVMVGLSRGAITAYGLAARAPDRAEGLVLAFPVSGFADTLYQETPDRPTGGDGGDPVDAISRQVFSSGFLELRRDEAVTLLTSSPGSVARVERVDETAFDEKIGPTCPILVIEGGADAVVGSEHPASYLIAHPEAAHLVVPEAHHGWLMEQPDAFAAVLAGFVSDLP